MPAANTIKDRLDKESVAVLDAVKTLLAEGNNDGVLSLVSKLITTHAKQLRAALEQQRRRAKNEGVSGAQLELIFAELSKCIDENAKRQNDKLREAMKKAPLPFSLLYHATCDVSPCGPAGAYLRTAKLMEATA